MGAHDAGWTPELGAEIQRLYVEEGWSLRRIAYRHKVDVRLVRAHLTSVGVTIHRAHRMRGKR